MKGSRIASATRIFLLTIIICQQVVAQTAGDYYNRALEQSRNRQYKEAIKNYDKAIDLNEQFANAYQGRGNAYFALKLYDDAFGDYDDAITLAPKNPANWYNRGSLYNAVEFYDSAIMDLNEAIRLNPRYANAYHNRGLSYLHLHQYDFALQDFSRAVEIDPNMLNGFNNRGSVYMFLGQYELAVNDYKKAYSLDSNFSRAYAVLNLLEPLARLYRFSEAADYYQQYQANYKIGYINNKGLQFLKKFVEAVTGNLTKNDFAGALVNLTSAEEMYFSQNAKEEANDFQRRNYSSILALKGYVLEKLDKTELASQAYQQTLLINAVQPDVTAAVQRLTQKKAVIVQQDITPPAIKILEPLSNSRSISVDDDKVAGTKQHIRGVAADPSGIKSVKLNNRFLTVDEKGYFDTVVEINPGINIFTLLVTDNNANSSSENVQIVTGKDAAASAPMMQSGPVNCNPVYHAVLIAEKDYANKNIPSLPGTVKDMRRMYNLLVNNYNFAPENVDTLVNATRVTVMETLINRGNEMKENDNLLIFYAGHGVMKSKADRPEEGYLLPQDAIPDALSTYINSYELVGTFKDSKAMHILFVADACFAGQLFRHASADAPPPKSTCAELSRNLVASGNRKAVPDNSPFIQYLADALSKNRKPDITVEELIDSFKYSYRDNTQLELQFYPINVGDQGGHFVFKRKG